MPPASFTPIKSHSWEQLTESVALKQTDKSVFIHNGTGVPHDIRGYFEADNLENGQRINLHLQNRNILYEAKIEMGQGKTRMFWRKEFASLLRQEYSFIYTAFSKNTLPQSALPVLRFEKSYNNIFRVDIVGKSIVEDDIINELDDEIAVQREGKRKEYFGKRYERKSALRRRAIEIHGTKCHGCAFDFSLVYGSRGEGFIEIHHTKPLSMSDEEQVVNVEEDLVPVCSNCHRMIHRKRDEVLTMEDLKALIRTRD